MPRRANKNHKGKAGLEERRQRAVDLRIAGATYREIARQLGVSLPTAHKDVDQGLARIIDATDASLRKLQGIEVARLDRLLLGVWVKAREGDPKAVNSALRISERRCKLLGLDLAREPAVSVETSEGASVVFRFSGPGRGDGREST